MKQLLAGIVCIIVLGLGAFLYRNVTERPGINIPAAGECTLEAKLCPDGTSVGRTGPSCTFAPCAYPNIEITDAGIALALPAGYAAQEGGDETASELLATFVKQSSSANHTIQIYKFPLSGKSAEEVMVSRTRFSPSDIQAEDMSDFSQVTIGEKVFYSVTIERFEGMVQTAYYLPLNDAVLRFDIVEHDVQNWTDPSLIVSDLPEQRALREMLTTLQITSL